MRKLSPHQLAVMDLFKKKSEITLSDAVGVLGKHYYANARFHVAMVLSRMVKRGLIVRIKPGHFRPPNPVESVLFGERGAAKSWYQMEVHAYEADKKS